MKLASLLRLFPLFLLLALAGCNEDRWSWQQRLTLNVDTPAGVKSASSVVSCEAAHLYGALVLPDARSFGVGCEGEAVMLEVTPGRYLFALLPQPNAISVFFPGRDRTKVVEKLVKLRETRLLPPKLYPRLVTFGDINDPTSVQRVDPAELAASFGPGVRLKSITLEITDAPVSTGKVEAVLGWWCDYRTRQARLNGSTSIAVSTNDLPDVLGTGAFRIGDCK